MAMLRERLVGTGEGINPGEGRLTETLGTALHFAYKVEAECNNSWDYGQQSITANHLDHMREVVTIMTNLLENVVTFSQLRKYIFPRISLFVYSSINSCFL